MRSLLEGADGLFVDRAVIEESRRPPSLRKTLSWWPARKQEPQSDNLNTSQDLNAFGWGPWALDEPAASFTAWISAWGDPEQKLFWPLSLLKLHIYKQMLLEAVGFAVVCCTATGNQCIYSPSFTKNFKPNGNRNQFETEYKFLGFLSVSLSNFNHDSQV